MATLAEIRAKLAAMDTKSGGSKQGGDNAIYPFWNISEGTSATLRFLPDGDPSNTFFWTERQMIRLAFPGIKGGDMKPTTVQVPCMEMWGEQCPVHNEIRPWFKDASLEDMGRKYWKKRSYIFQGYVCDSPLQEDTTPENPIRRFIIGPQIFNIIKGALMDPDMENIPTDYVNGTDFRLSKTMKGQYADYSTSKWARKERSLDETELAAVDSNGLYNLKDYLPKKPSEAEVDIIYQMFQDSVNGELYDNEKYGEHFRPNGQAAPVKLQATTPPAQSTTPVAPVTAPAVETPAPVVETLAPVVAPVVQTASANEAPATTDSKASAEDILAMIRNRQQ
jgi:hypothetical protein|tara:strand:+ start:1488 stop:2495 length:1008 start_codon:yes stop_codon:yes gene_type:complete